MSAPRAAAQVRPPPPPVKGALPLPEFVAMMALLMALNALSIDAMLPAMPEIAAAVTPDAPNRAQLVVTSFVLGMGLGMVVMGPLSDTLGRKRVIGVGVGIYILGALAAMLAPSLPALIAARLVQGMGISAVRTAGVALVRDLYAGRRMAQVMSIVMTIFILVPAAAPAMGQVVIVLAGWRAVFLAFMVIGLVALGWVTLRQPETLPPERRRPFRAAAIGAALGEVFANRRVVIYLAVLSLGFGQFFAFLSTAQQIYDVQFGKADSFPLWFAGGALIAGTSSLINATLVMRLGMRRIAATAFTTQVVVSGVMLMAWQGGLIPEGLRFPAFFVWSTALFYMAGVTFGNLNALALEPLGHIAGLGAAVVGAVSTVAAVAIAVPIGLAFDGTPTPVILGAFACSSAATLLMRRTREAEGTLPKA